MAKMGGGLPKGMAQQIQAMQQQLANAQAEIAKTEVVGSAGGGAVKVTLRGDQTCTGVEISPDLLQDADAEMLQDLVLAAFNQAQAELTKLSEERLGPLANMLGM